MAVRGFFVWLAMAAAAGQALAQTRQETVFSPQTAEVFVKTAQEIFRGDGDAETALRFLEAAATLDRNPAQVAEQTLRIGAASCLGRAEHTEAMLTALRSYVSAQSDLEIVFGAIRCILTQLDTRQDREVMLDRWLRRYATVNGLLGSEIAAQAGLLAVEKTDFEGATGRLNYAYQLNPYNALAFDALRDVYAEQGRVVTAEAYVVHLRRMLDVDPYDLDTALRYADMLAGMELNERAGRMYEYADGVFRYHFADQTPDHTVYVPWLLSLYRTPRQASKCFETAERLGGEVGFDLMLEAVAGRAAARMGNAEAARAILERAAEQAERLLGETDIALPIYPEHLAWFYSFILERPDNALAWANQAFSQAPDRQGVAPIFAFTLAMNDQLELAIEYAEPYVETDQTAAVAAALARRGQDDRQGAIDLLRKAIEMAPNTFEAEKARSLLADLGSAYITPTFVQDVEKALDAQFGGRAAPVFVQPRQRFSTKLLFSGSDVFYGADLSPRLVIENTGSAPIVIQDQAMLSGYLRVDVSVTGDVTAEFPDLMNTRIRPGRAIRPNEHITIPLDLMTGRLRRLLMTYPQASLELEFTVYLDPVIGEDGGVANRLKEVVPIRATVRRRGVNLTRDFLMQRLDALSRGQEGQKVQATRLFAGLLAEQEALRQGRARYAYTQVEPSLLIDAVRRTLTDENWRLRVQTMDAVSILTLPSDVALIRTLSENLHHDRWPVRFMALHLLSQLQKETFRPVLDWTAHYDVNNLNRRLAVALGGTEPLQPEREPSREID